MKCKNCEQLEETIIEIQNRQLMMSRAWDEFDTTNEEYIKSLVREIAELKAKLEGK